MKKMKDEDIRCLVDDLVSQTECFSNLLTYLSSNSFWLPIAARGDIRHTFVPVLSPGHWWCFFFKH